MTNYTILGYDFTDIKDKVDTSGWFDIENSIYINKKNLGEIQLFKSDDYLYFGFIFANDFKNKSLTLYHMMNIRAYVDNKLQRTLKLPKNYRKRAESPLL